MRNRVEKAKQQKILDLNKKIGDRECLIKEAKGIDQLLQEANESLRYYELAQKSGIEFNEEDIQSMKEVGELIASLEEQKIRIDKIINDISGMPEILDKLHGDALTENDRIDAKQKEEEARKEFESRIDNIAQKIKMLYNSEIEKPKLLGEAWYDVEVKEKEIWDMVKEAKEIVGVSDSDHQFRKEIDKAVEESLKAKSQIVQTLKENLQEIRKKPLGWGGNKKKKAINFILSGNAEEFSEYEKLMGDYLKLKEDKELEKEKKRVADEYGKIIEEARKIQDEIDENKDDLPAGLMARLDNQIKKLANITHYDESGKEEKRYGSWNSDENRVFREMWKDIDKQSNAFNLAYGTSKRESEK